MDDLEYLPDIHIWQLNKNLHILTKYRDSVGISAIKKMWRKTFAVQWLAGISAFHFLESRSPKRKYLYCERRTSPAVHVKDNQAAALQRPGLFSEWKVVQPCASKFY